MIKISITPLYHPKNTLFSIFCNNEGGLFSCNKNGKAMISEQIIEDYLEQENNYQDWITKIKLTVLLISITALILFSL